VSTHNHSNGSPDAAALSRALLGPMWLRVRRIPLIRREVRESLSDNALELLFGSAELLVEGERDGQGQADRAYATVMVTLDLARCASVLREPADEATAERVAELMRGSASVRRQLIELARPKLAELVGEARERMVRIELLPVVRVSGARILIDGDAVVSLRPKQDGKEGHG
jgi:hypothetical protein